ncbi:MAG: copper resistance protein CopC [Nitriliruptoraceae bacterium]
MARIVGRAAGLLLALATALVVNVWNAPPAMGHAVLIESVPRDGAALEVAPERVILTFSEPVTVPSGGVRVFDADATRVDLGPAQLGDATQAGVDLQPGLADGAYVISWRVVSADSHPVSGVFTFTVGEALALDTSVLETFADEQAGISTVLRALLRAATYLATLIAAGLLYARWLFGRHDSVRSRVRLPVVGAAGAAVACSVVSIPVHAMDITGFGLTDIATSAVLADVAVSSFGQSTAFRLIWLAMLVLFAWRRAPEAAQLLAGTLAVVSFVFDGHQRSVEPTWLLMTADGLHVIAAAFWMGGLAVAAVVAKQVWQNNRLDSATELLTAFSNAALWLLLVVAATGSVMSWTLVGGTDGLSTGYGYAWLVKMALVVVVVAIAAYNRWKLLPNLVALDWRRLALTLRIEVGALASVLVATGVLVSLPPAVQQVAAESMFADRQWVDDRYEVELVVEPGRVGVNALHLYVLDADGRPSADVDDVVLELLYVPEQIGPARLSPFFAGTGHWIANVDDLQFPGRWQITVVFAADRFSEHRVTFDVDVR